MSPRITAPGAEELAPWIDEALDLARRAASEDEVPVGAVVVRLPDASVPGDVVRVVGRGYNRRERDHNPVAHAEILAIADAARTLASWRLVGCILVVTLEPCPMCLAACQQARLEHVFYGAVDPKGGALSLGYPIHQDARTNHRFEVTRFETHPECGAVLKEFFARKRRS